MVATREPSICKRFFADAFAPPAGFHSSARNSEVTAEEILAGGINESDWSFPVIISTPTEDRVGDVVIPEGCDSVAFSATPIVFFDHQDIKFPVGSLRSPHDGRLYFCIEPGVGIIGRIWINRREGTQHSEACRDVFYLVVDGLLNGVSVGFEPKGRVKSLSGGGSLYSEWELLEISIVAIPANRDCVVIRKYLDESARKGKRFDPLILKSLTAMSTSAPAVSKHIRHEGGKWVLYDHTGNKVLGRHDTEEGAVKQEEAIKANEKSAETEVTKAMSESSGTGGGFTVPEGNEQDDQAIRKAIADRMADHADGEHGGTHEAYHHADTGAVHHVHGEEASEEHLKSVVTDLEEIPGVKKVTQSTKPPADGGGWQAAYPSPKAPVTKSDEEMEQERVEKRARRKAKRLAVLVERGQHLMGLLRKNAVSWRVRKSIEDCVHHKIPILMHEGHDQKQSEAIAFSMCGEARKFLQPLVSKAMQDYATKDEDEDEDNLIDRDNAAEAEINPELETDVDTADELKPPSLSLDQAIVENIEAALPGIEPSMREFYEGIVQQTRDHGMEHHPEEDFGGEQTPDESENPANDAKEQEETNKDLARYKSASGWKVKHRRVSVQRRLKSMSEMSRDHAKMLDRWGAHFHKLHGFHRIETKEGVLLRGAKLKDLADCGIMGREVDRTHGAVTKAVDESPKKVDEEAATNPKTAEGQQAEHDLDLDRLMPELKSLNDRFEAANLRVGKLAYQVTGKRA